MNIKTKILILGNSSFVRKRVLQSLKKIKDLKIIICSKSSKINKDNLVFFNDYKKAINSKPNIVYISLINKLHFKFAKFALEKNCNVIVDKPITKQFKLSKQLVEIAKKKKLFLAEATIFNYHSVYKKIIKIIGGINKITHIQSNFNIPLIKKISNIKNRDDDALMDMSPYAAAIVRIFFKNHCQLSIKKINYQKTKYVKSFSIFCKSENISYFGNFGTESEYISEVRFFSKRKIITINHQAFALPSNNTIPVFIKEKNRIKVVKFSKDDAIKNFIQGALRAIKLKNYEMYYNKILTDSKFREGLRIK